MYEKFVEFQELVENQFEKKIKKLRSDNGTEYTNRLFVQLFKKKEFRMTTRMLNPSRERSCRTYKQNNWKRCALIDSGMPSRYWPYAVQYMPQVRMCPPAHLWISKLLLNFGMENVRLHEITPFGCTCVAKVIDKIGKFGDRGAECRLLCLSTDRNG